MRTGRALRQDLGLLAQTSPAVARWTDKFSLFYWGQNGKASSTFSKVAGCGTESHGLAVVRVLNDLVSLVSIYNKRLAANISADRFSGKTHANHSLKDYPFSICTVQA